MSEDNVGQREMIKARSGLGDPTIPLFDVSEDASKFDGIAPDCAALESGDLHKSLLGFLLT